MRDEESGYILQKSFNNNEAKNSEFSQVGVVLQKYGNYWLYHRDKLETTEQEMESPVDKLWRITKFFNSGLSETQQKGYRIRIGDVLKFGRVRFRVMSFHNQTDGLQTFQSTLQQEANQHFDSEESADHYGGAEEGFDDTNRLQQALNKSNINQNSNLELDNFEKIEEEKVQEMLRNRQGEELPEGEHEFDDMPSDGEQENSKQSMKDIIEANKKSLEKLGLDGVPICRICLGEENTFEDRLITPCLCSGTMKYIHLSCLRGWIESKKKFKTNDFVATYLWKGLACELCKSRFPDQLQIKFDGRSEFVQLVQYDKPEKEFIILESVTLQPLKMVHVINMDHEELVKVGRDSNSDIKITDISVSRLHAAIQRSFNKKEKFYILLDNNSKFGTLSLLRQPIMIEPERKYFFQTGRSVLEVFLAGTIARCGCWQRLFKCKSNKVQKTFAVKENSIGELYPEEFVRVSKKAKKKKKQEVEVKLAPQAKKPHNPKHRNQKNKIFALETVDQKEGINYAKGTSILHNESEVDRRNELESSLAPLNIRDRSGIDVNSSLSYVYGGGQRNTPFKFQRNDQLHSPYQLQLERGESENQGVEEFKGVEMVEEVKIEGGKRGRRRNGEGESSLFLNSIEGEGSNRQPAAQEQEHENFLQRIEKKAHIKSRIASKQQQKQNSTLAVKDQANTLIAGTIQESSIDQSDRLDEQIEEGRRAAAQMLQIQEEEDDV